LLAFVGDGAYDFLLAIAMANIFSSFEQFKFLWPNFWNEFCDASDDSMALEGSNNPNDTFTVTTRVDFHRKLSENTTQFSRKEKQKWLNFCMENAQLSVEIFASATVSRNVFRVTMHFFLDIWPIFKDSLPSLAGFQCNSTPKKHSKMNFFPVHW